jgi:hypothetical protein
MLFIVDPDICFPGDTLLFNVVKGPSELVLCCTGHISHIVGPKEVVKQEHISVPSIPGPQSRLDVDKARVLATNICACHSQRIILCEVLLQSFLGTQFHIPL